MIKIGILGDIGSGKSYIARCFRCPVFNADHEVSKLYKSDFKVFKKLKKSLPKFIYSFPISKNEIMRAILSNKSNLKKIVKIVHLEIKKKMVVFLRKHEFSVLRQKVLDSDFLTNLEYVVSIYFHYCKMMTEFCIK